MPGLSSKRSNARRNPWVSVHVLNSALTILAQSAGLGFQTLIRGPPLFSTDVLLRAPG